MTHEQHIATLRAELEHLDHGGATLTTWTYSACPDGGCLYVHDEGAHHLVEAAGGAAGDWYQSEAGRSRVHHLNRPGIVVHGIEVAAKVAS